MTEVSATGLKYIGIDKQGRNAVRSGSIEPFTGFPESLRNRFIVALQFSDASLQLLSERILTPIAQIEDDLECHFKLANRDFPVHATLLEGQYERTGSGSSDAERDRTFLVLRTDLSSSDAELEKLQGVDIVYRYVLLDKGNLLLTAIEIPTEILSLRDSLARQYEEMGLKPLPLTNILHISLARMSRLPAGNTLANGTYSRRVRQELRKPVARDPILLTVSGTNIGNTLDFLNRVPEASNNPPQSS